MAHHFFPGSIFNHMEQQPQPGFTPLFRLLEDYDRYSTNNGQTAQGHSGARAGAGAGAGTGASVRASSAVFQPKFDVRETEKNYELLGELPGAKRENIHIEFSGPQTLLIRGRIERTYTAGTPPAGLIGNQDTDTNTITGGSEAGNDEHRDRTVSPDRTASPHRATVEDDTEEEGNTTSTSTDNNEVARTTGSRSQAANPTGNNVNHTKYWITERSIGEFTRTFTLPSRVEQDGVSASLKDGVLTVTIPKAKRHEARRINVD